MVKFDYIIGNPPYQDEILGENKTFAPPIYHSFMDAVFGIGGVVELITPARFLFNAGSTPKAWNKKMLNDNHFSVLKYYPNSKDVFANVGIAGGVVVTVYDKKRYVKPINVFSGYETVNVIIPKVVTDKFRSLDEIIYTQTCFDLPALYDVHPELKCKIGSEGKDRRFRNNIFEYIPLFTDDCERQDDIKVFCVSKNKRFWKYIDKRYVDLANGNLLKWKAIVPATGAIEGAGAIFSSPLVLKPGEGYTQSFIGIGSFDDEVMANNALKYIKSKFLRLMLCVLKATQHNDRNVWKYVPLQDFTSNSDIDWAASIPNIDRQLYRKYGLTQEEIDFIETHVKAMA